MNDQSQVSSQRKPKSLLQAHQEAEELINALNEYAASQQTPVSRDMMSDPSLCPQVALQCVRSLPKPTTIEPSPDPPEDTTPEATSSIEPNVKPRSTRRKPVESIQPSIPQLLEWGVKVRDFAYERTLPPVPTVYLQPRQIQPSEPKDVNDPNDPHYVLEEERKKKVYSFASTRKIERTATEPVLESDLLPPPRREFPKIKRTHAQLDLGSQPQSYSPSHPLHLLPDDAINKSPESQPVPGLTMDSQPAEQWVDTPIVTPNGSLQWPMDPNVTDTSAVPESQLDSDSQAPPIPEPLSYSQMGFSHPASPQSPTRDNGHRAPLLSSHARSPSTGVGGSPGISIHISPMRHLTPNSPLNPRRNDGDRGRVESQSLRRSPLAVASPFAPAQSPSSRQPHGSSPPSPSPSSGPVPPIIPSTSALSPTPRYNFRTKRRAESPAPTSLGDEHPSTRPRLTRSMATQITSSSTKSIGVKPPLSVKSAHAQGSSSKATTSAGRTLRRGRAVTAPTPAPATDQRETRSSKRRNHVS